MAILARANPAGGAPLVSIVTLSYNSAHLFESIDSVLAQDYPLVEYIISDDGSQHFPEAEIRARFDQANRTGWTLRVLRETENRGTVRNINKAFHHASGVYLFCLSAGDAFVSETIITQWVHEFKETGANVMCARALVYDQHMRRHLYTVPDARQAEHMRSMSPEALYQDLCQINYIMGCCTARTKASLEQYGYFDEQYRLVEDYPMNLRLLRMGVPIRLWDQPAIRYRQGGASAELGFHDAYIRDSDLIYENEQYRYASDPVAIRRWYTQWRERRIRKRAFLLAFHAAKRQPIKLAALFARHPWLTVTSTLGRIRRRFGHSRG
ncbi:MAG: glycosyltransferase [Candidatus Limiplasma sp.]|nr:glycosyltransferase [Candidatus Limiplasma sp.]